MPRASTSPPARRRPYDRSDRITYTEADEQQALVPRSDDEKLELEYEKPDIDSDSDEYQKPDIESEEYIPVGRSKKGGKGAAAKKGKGSVNSSKKGNVKWSPDEDWILFQMLHPRVDKPNWDAISAALGERRDAKSCKNRHYAWMSTGKFEGAIKRID